MGCLRRTWASASPAERGSGRRYTATVSENLRPHEAASPAGVHETPAGETVKPRRPLWQRITVLAFLAFFAWHGYATVAWLSGSPALMRLGPVEQYIDPIFRQNWSVFAPNPEDFNTMVQVRAELANGEETEWFDITQQDLEDSIQGVPMLSRMYQSNFMLALHTLNDVNQITDEERETVLGDGQVLSEDEIQAQLKELGATVDEGFVERVLNENESLTTIASEVARARWGDGNAENIARVQYQILVVETERAPWIGDGPEAYLFDWQPGWREPIWHPGINSEEFVDRYGPERTNDQAVVSGAESAS